MAEAFDSEHRSEFPRQARAAYFCETFNLSRFRNGIGFHEYHRSHTHRLLKINNHPREWRLSFNVVSRTYSFFIVGTLTADYATIFIDERTHAYIYIHAENDSISRIIFFNYDNTRVNRGWSLISLSLSLLSLVLVVAASSFANGKLQIFVIPVRS